MEQQQTIEQALRAQGWVEDTYGNLPPLSREDYYFLRDGRVLRAPRPEPEYKPGTVAVVRGNSSGKVANAFFMPNGQWLNPAVWPMEDTAAEVLRVLADPDGNPPEEDDAPTLNSIRETGRTAVDEDGDLWYWHEVHVAFYTFRGRPSKETLVAATAPGFFTRWATEDEVEQA